MHNVCEYCGNKLHITFYYRLNGGGRLKTERHIITTTEEEDRITTEYFSPENSNFDWTKWYCCPLCARMDNPKISIKRYQKMFKGKLQWQRP